MVPATSKDKPVKPAAPPPSIGQGVGKQPKRSRRERPVFKANSDDDERQPHQATQRSPTAVLSEKDSASRRSRDDESDDTPRAIFDRQNRTRGSPTREPKPATIESRFTQIDSTRRKSDRDKQPATATHAEE